MNRGIWRYFDHRFTPCERFNDRARLVMALSEQFAAEQHSPRIEPEHVLRALGSADRGVARTVLEGLGVDLLSLLPCIAATLPRLANAFSPGHSFGPRTEAL